MVCRKRLTFAYFYIIFLQDIVSRTQCEAEQKLTPDERNWINNQYRKVINKPEVDSSSESDVSSKGEGLSKVKGVEPGNWGAVNITPDEMDVGAQEAAFASYKEAKRLVNEDNPEDQDTPLHGK